MKTDFLIVSSTQKTSTRPETIASLVLHYLMPDLFPKTEQGWFNRLADITFYVDDDRCEQEDLEDLDPHQVKRIVIWEKRWESAPMAFPDLAQSRYIVRIETL